MQGPRQETSIRRADQTNIEDIVRLEAASSLSPWGKSQFMEELRKPSSQVWVLERAGRAVGFGVVWLVAREAQLAEWAVDAGCRRQGHGRALLRHFLVESKKQGACRMTLEVSEDNKAALALYASEGFFETHRRPGFYPGRRAALLMEKAL